MNKVSSEKDEIEIHFCGKNGNLILKLGLSTLSLKRFSGLIRSTRENLNFSMTSLIIGNHKCSVQLGFSSKPEKILDIEFHKDVRNHTFSIRVFHKPNKYPMHGHHKHVTTLQKKCHYLRAAPSTYDFRLF